MAAITYTITNVNAKPGSIVVTPSVITNSDMPEYYLNINTAKLRGSNPFLADGSTLNPQATFSIFLPGCDKYLIKDMFMSEVTNIGGSATPATLALTLAAIAALLAE